MSGSLSLPTLVTHDSHSLLLLLSVSPGVHRRRSVPLPSCRHMTSQLNHPCHPY